MEVESLHWKNLWLEFHLWVVRSNLIRVLSRGLKRNDLWRCIRRNKRKSTQVCEDFLCNRFSCLSRRTIFSLLPWLDKALGSFRNMRLNISSGLSCNETHCKSLVPMLHHLFLIQISKDVFKRKRILSTWDIRMYWPCGIAYVFKLWHFSSRLE